MRHYLMNGDEVIADNIKLVYRSGEFVVPEDGLTHCLKYVFDEPTELECELKFTGDTLRPYYDEPEID